MRIAGKVAVVTGGGSGIGRATAMALAALGSKVVVADLREESGNDTVAQVIASGGTARFARCDVTVSSDIANALDIAVAEYGGLDIVHNNAGIGEIDLFAWNGGNWRKVIEIDLMATIDGTRQAVGIMKTLGSEGVIINTGSMIGLWPMPSSPVYAAAKAGVVNFTRSLAYLKDELGIRVNTVCPELVDTPLAAPMGEEFLQKARREGGILKPEQIAQAVIDLIEDESRAGVVLTISIGEGRSYVNPTTQQVD